MGDLVNLRQARKARARSQRRARADENAARFGQGKAERDALALERERAERRLDAHALNDAQPAQGRPAPSPAARNALHDTGTGVGAAEDAGHGDTPETDRDNPDAPHR